MRVSLINMRSMKQMGLTIRSSASMISFMLQSQSSIGQIARMKMFLRSLFKCSGRTSKIFTRSSILSKR